MSIQVTKDAENCVITLVDQIVIEGKIRLLTGLHIGGTESELSIGGVDSVVIRNGVDGKPYIPGSSLKGKMRCLLEKVYCPGELKKVGNSRIFVCSSLKDYNSPDPSKGLIYHLFGTTPEDIDNLILNGDGSNDCPIRFAMPTRLVFRDAFLDEESSRILEDSLYVDLPYTQVKTEVVIDRIKSQATPRKIERVPAGVAFNFQIVFSLYDPPDLQPEWLSKYIGIFKEGIELVENDYIGGHGSRGYGQVKFEEISIRNKREEVRREIKELYDWASSRKALSELSN